MRPPSYVILLLLLFVMSYVAEQLKTENKDLDNVNKIPLVRANPSKRFKRSMDPNYFSEQFASILDNMKKSNYDSAVQIVIKVLGQFGKYLYENYGKTKTPDFKVFAKLGAELQMIIDHEFQFNSGSDKYYSNSNLEYEFIRKIPERKRVLKEVMEEFKKFSEDTGAEKSHLQNLCGESLLYGQFYLFESFYYQMKDQYEYFPHSPSLLSLAIEKFDLNLFNEISIQFSAAAAQASILALGCIYAKYILVQKPITYYINEEWPYWEEMGLDISRKLSDISGSIQYGVPYVKFYLNEWKEVESKVDELMKSNQGESHQKFAERVYGYLTLKYYWKAWFVGSYNETHGWDQHAVINWKHSLFRMRKYGRSLIIGAPQSKLVNNNLKIHYQEIKRSPDPYYPCFNDMTVKLRTDRNGFTNLCLDIVNDLASCFSAEGFTLIACIKWGNGFKASWNIHENDILFENVGIRINHYEYYKHFFDLGTYAEHGLKAYTVIWIR